MSDHVSPETVRAAVQDQMPVSYQAYDPGACPTGLVVVDEVNGFATVGAGALAPQAQDDSIDRMVRETDTLARRFTEGGWPIAVFLDSHEPGKAEPPYPPHCEKGTGEDELVPQLKWLESCPQATLIRKDCINGFIGAAAVETGQNQIVDWVRENGLQAVIVVGICTDICVMDFVLTLLSARNHGILGALKDIVVYEPACATFDLPRETAVSLNLLETAAHPQAAAHHLGLYFMAARGAVMADRLTAA